MNGRSFFHSGVGRCLAPFTLFLLILPADTVADPGPGVPGLAAARGLFEAARYEEAEHAFGLILEAHPDSAELHFWRAYTVYKRGRLEEAEIGALDALRFDPGHVDAHYLSALAAYRRGNRSVAKKRFRRLARIAPGSPLGDSATEYLAAIRWQEDRDAAVKLFASGRYDLAAVELERLYTERPDDLVTGYYRAYAALKLGRLRQALEWFEALLAKHPDDSWSRFMRAMTLSRLGRRSEALASFHRLAGSTGSDVAAEARAAIAALRESGVEVSSHESPRSRRASSWRLSLFGDLDSNPAYIPESSYVASISVAPAVSAAASGEVEIWASGATHLYLGPTVLLRTYPNGPGEYDLADIEARIEMVHHLKTLKAFVGVGSEVQLLGWDLFLDVQEIYAGVLWDQALWAGIKLSAAGYRRASHLDEYRNLEAWGLRGNLGQRVRVFDALWIEVGYGAQGEQAAPYTTTWTGTIPEIEPLQYSALLSAEASFLGHGPLAGLLWRLPWRELQFTISGALQWRRYSNAEDVVFDVDGELSRWKERRWDRLLSLVASLSVKVSKKIYLFTRYQAVFNGSNLSGEDLPVERSYSRQLLSAGVEARF